MINNTTYQIKYKTRWQTATAAAAAEAAHQPAWLAAPWASPARRRVGLGWLGNRWFLLFFFLINEIVPSFPPDPPSPPRNFIYHHNFTPNHSKIIQNHEKSSLETFCSDKDPDSVEHRLHRPWNIKTSTKTFQEPLQKHPLKNGNPWTNVSWQMMSFDIQNDTLYKGIYVV